MGMPLTDLIAGVFQPAANLIDELHVSDEERIQARENLLNVQATVLDNALNYEKSLVEAQARIITAEASSDSWLASNWRPMVMVGFFILVVLDSFGYVKGWAGTPLSTEAYGLLKLGLGGYVAGRSFEKVAKATAGIVAEKVK